MVKPGFDGGCIVAGDGASVDIKLNSAVRVERDIRKRLAVFM